MQQHQPLTRSCWLECISNNTILLHHTWHPPCASLMSLLFALTGAPSSYMLFSPTPSATVMSSFSAFFHILTVSWFFFTACPRSLFHDNVVLFLLPNNAHNSKTTVDKYMLTAFTVSKVMPTSQWWSWYYFLSNTQNVRCFLPLCSQKLSLTLLSWSVINVPRFPLNQVTILM